MIDTRPLWTILKDDYGFTPHSFYNPINAYEQFRKQFFPKSWLKLFPIITFEQKSDDHLSIKVGEDLYVVSTIDIWYTRLTKNDKTIFDARRFDNEELLKFLPNAN